MRKRRFTAISDIEQRIFEINGEQIAVEFRYSLRRRSTSLRLSKNKFICNTNPRFPRQELDTFIIKSVPKLVEKTTAKPQPILLDDVYIFGEKAHIDGFSTWSKQKQNKYLREILLPYVTEKTEYYESLMGVDAHYIVKVREAHTVYGVNHRTKKTIMFAMGLVHYNKHTIDSVITHELTHHFVLGHGPKFYKILLKVTPDYWDSRKKLIRNIYD